MNERQLLWQVLIVSRAMPKEVYHTGGGLRRSQRINLGCVNDSEGRKCLNGGTKSEGKTTKKYVSGRTVIFELLPLLKTQNNLTNV